MAVFLLKAFEGEGYTPPACVTEVFTDVPCSSPFAPWVNEIAARGATAGCGDGTTFCPGDPTNRQQMAAFLLKSLEGSGYVPPSCVTPAFDDVPCTNPFAPWINELVARGVTAGCGGANYCPGRRSRAPADGGVSREDVRPRAVRPLGFQTSIGSSTGAASAAPVFFRARGLRDQVGLAQRPLVVLLGDRGDVSVADEAAVVQPDRPIAVVPDLRQRV